MREAGSEEWLELANLDSMEKWKCGVKSILQYYSERIEGSRIEELHSALLFKYNDAEDAATAFRQAGECANHINDSCLAQNVHAVPIDQGLWVSDADVNKSSATTVIGDKLLHLKAENNEVLPELLLVIGDSRDDEYVFNWAHQMEKKGIRDVCTVTLGARNTEASATLTQGVTGKYVLF